MSSYKLSSQKSHFDNRSYKENRKVSEQDSIKFLNESSQFSFSKALFQSGRQSIRSDLSKLEKEDLIEILLQQIQQTKALRLKINTMEEQCKIMTSFRQDYRNQRQITDELISMKKYTELAEYMQQYINNTNEAQNHFSKMISELKQRNLQIKQQNKNLKNAMKRFEDKRKDSQGYRQRVIELEQNVKQLEDSLSHYVNINNEHTRKYEKLKKMYDASEHQLALVFNSNHTQNNLTSQAYQNRIANTLFESRKQNNNQLPGGKKNDHEQVQLREKIKILQINNNELKEAYLAIQKVLQGKSDKIRKLLEELQKLSQQKWIYKERYMQLKSKSFSTHQSMDKSSIFDSISKNETIVQDFSYKS